MSNTSIRFNRVRNLIDIRQKGQYLAKNGTFGFSEKFLTLRSDVFYYKGLRYLLIFVDLFTVH